MGLPANVPQGGTLRVHRSWTSRKASKGKVALRRHPKGEGRAGVPQVREICLWATGALLPLLVGDGCSPVQTAGILEPPAFLSAYPSVQMEFSVILSLPENEIQLQGKNC